MYPVVLVFCPHLAACSLGLSATSQQYFSLRTNQPPANQPAVLFSQNKPAPAISHQPTEQAVELQDAADEGVVWFSICTWFSGAVGLKGCAGSRVWGF
jgi:hypothetical protein